MRILWKLLLLLIAISVVGYIFVSNPFHASHTKKNTSPERQPAPADTDTIIFQPKKDPEPVIYKPRPQPKLYHDRQEFRYPLEVDIVDLVQKVLDRNVSIDLAPLNDVSRHPTVHSPVACFDEAPSPGHDRHPKPIDLLLVVKSSADHFEHRKSIRNIWGKPSCWGGFHIRRVFTLGRYQAKNASSLVEMKKENETKYLVAAEAAEFQDIVQMDFVESYYNVTLKLHCALEWVARHCSRARDFLFVDDDVLVHPRRVVRYLTHDLTLDDRWKYILWGNEMSGSPAIRDPLGPLRKWYISPADYPYEAFPTYPSGAAYFVSPFHLKRLAVAMRYIKYIPFDDAYLGIVIVKLNTSMVQIGHMLDIFHRKDGTLLLNQTIGHHMSLDDSKRKWTEFNYHTFCL